MTGSPIQDIFSWLGLPDVAIAIATGELALPEPMIPAVKCEYNRPPALLPIWGNDSDDFVYFGLWRHWPIATRRPVFVQYHSNDGFIEEYGATFPQLLEFYCVRTFGAPPRGRERAFLQAVGLDSIEPFVGRQTRALLGRKEFAGYIPAALADACDLPYSGEFPHRSKSLSPTDCRTMCDIEVPDHQRTTVYKTDTSPPWFNPANQQQLFEELFSQQDYAGAWLSLNSDGWETRSAASALRRLSDAVDNSDFSRYAGYWISSIPVDCRGTY